MSEEDPMHIQISKKFKRLLGSKNQRRLNKLRNKYFPFLRAWKVKDELDGLILYAQYWAALSIDMLKLYESDPSTMLVEKHVVSDLDLFYSHIGDEDSGGSLSSSSESLRKEELRRKVGFLPLLQQEYFASMTEMKYKARHGNENLLYIEEDEDENDVAADASNSEYRDLLTMPDRKGRRDRKVTSACSSQVLEIYLTCVQSKPMPKFLDALLKDRGFSVYRLQFLKTIDWYYFHRHWSKLPFVGQTSPEDVKESLAHYQEIRKERSAEKEQRAANERIMMFRRDTTRHYNCQFFQCRVILPYVPDVLFWMSLIAALAVLCSLVVILVPQCGTEDNECANYGIYIIGSVFVSLGAFSSYSILELFGNTLQNMSELKDKFMIGHISSTEAKRGPYLKNNYYKS